MEKKTWSKSFIDFVFKDIKKKKISIKDAAELIGATYGQVYKKYVAAKMGL